MSIHFLINALGVILSVHSVFNLGRYWIVQTSDNTVLRATSKVSAACSATTLIVFAIMCHIGSLLSADVFALATLLSLGVYISSIVLCVHDALNEKRSEIASLFLGITNNSELETKAEALELQAQFLISKIQWVISLYTSNSKCLFHSEDCILAISEALKANNSKEAIRLLSEHLDLLLFDKYSDEHRPMIEALSSFGGSDSPDVLKERVCDSELIEHFQNEKKLALSSLLTPRTIFIRDEVNSVIDNEDERKAAKIAKPLVDLYLYKTANGLEPSYRPVLLTQIAC